MHVLITGAAGFVGRALVAQLLHDGQIGGRRLTRLSLVDIGFGEAPATEGIVHRLAGDMADAAWLDAALGASLLESPLEAPGGGAPGKATPLDAPPLDAIFHLASLPGGLAESNPALGRRVNLDATIGLLERGRAQVEAGHSAPLFVFASTIAVLGAMPALVTDSTLPQPQMTYGAHKLVGEVLVDDYSRRGWIDGRSLRLPGVLARPPAPTGQLSAFLSNLVIELSAGRPFVCPMSPDATTWASSLSTVVGNLLDAARIDAAAWGTPRSLTVPTLRFSMAELVEALAEVHGPHTRALVTYAPEPRIQALFGRFPPLQAARASAAGLRTDANLVELVRASVAHLA